MKKFQVSRIKIGKDEKIHFDILDFFNSQEEARNFILNEIEKYRDELAWKYGSCPEYIIDSENFLIKEKWFNEDIIQWFIREIIL